MMEAIFKLRQFIMNNPAVVPWELHSPAFINTQNVGRNKIATVPQRHLQMYHFERILSNFDSNITKVGSFDKCQIDNTS